MIRISSGGMKAAALWQKMDEIWMKSAAFGEKVDEIWIDGRNLDSSAGLA